MHIRPLVAIVGRPNVGKSTLFNRLIGERRAVVHDQPGMTRDRHYADADYRMRPFTVIDTGGYEDNTDSPILQQMRQQSLIAMEEADIVIFLTAVNEPDDPADQEILERLRASGKRFVLAVNKAEGDMRIAQAYADFSRYGLDQIHPISALHGDGIFDLMDAVTEGFEQWDSDEEYIDNSGRIRVAIVGRQNVGKSTLVNRLLGEERVIANPIGGTTRDAIDTDVVIDGNPYTLIDTAGIRRRGSIERGPEMLSVHSSFRAIERADVAMLLIDATEGITAQDQHVAGFILERKRACIIVLNKWDAVPDREVAYGKMIDEVRREFNFMPWAPVLTMSALTGQRANKSWSLIRLCAENFAHEFPTRELNEVLQRATAYLSPPTHGGGTLTLKYVTQIRNKPPTLMIFVNDSQYLHFSYERFLRNQFYKQLGLEGTPLELRFRRKSPPHGWEKSVRKMRDEKTGFVRREVNEEDFEAGKYIDDGSEEVREFDLGGEEENPQS